MNWNAQAILSVLDRCCESFTFPMLDNGYVYPAATRLSLHRSEEDWAVVVEVFGFSPRSGIPDTHIYTFASRLRRTRKPEDFVSRQAYDAYIEGNAHQESTFVFPIEEGEWLASENPERLAPGSHGVRVRDGLVQTPVLPEYASHGITLEDPSSVHVFEFCRWLAATRRDEVLATPEERCLCLPPDVQQVLQLEEWFHPDVVNGERPSGSPTFSALAEILMGADAASYRPSTQPNTHWKNWPEGGTL